MGQLHLYLPEDVANRVKQRARAKGLSVSRYLAQIVVREVGASWPVGYFEDVAGGWRGGPLVRPGQGEYEEREALE
jgi:hypothetical protein